MRGLTRGDRGFTLIELIATITLIAIVAAVTLPRETAASLFADRGYADAVAAGLRQARAVAMTTGCAVQFSIDGTGYSAQQRGPGANNHCAAAGPWSTPVFSAAPPAHASLLANRQVVFDERGRAAAAVTITLGSRQVSVDTAGLVSGP